MVHDRLPKRVVSGELENAEQHGLGGDRQLWTESVAEDRRMFGITGGWSTAAQDPEVRCSTVT